MPRPVIRGDDETLAVTTNSDFERTAKNGREAVETATPRRSSKSHEKDNTDPDGYASSDLKVFFEAADVAAGRDCCQFPPTLKEKTTVFSIFLLRVGIIGCKIIAQWISDRVNDALFLKTIPTFVTQSVRATLR